MNSYLLALLLGVVEGLTEFLPVSSTAHLRISEALLGIDLGDGYWKMFSIVIQLGAILCLPVYFKERIDKFIGYEPGSHSVLLAPFIRLYRLLLSVFESRPVQLTLIAFICTAGPAFLLHKVIGKNLESLKVMGCALVVGGIIMWVVDALYSSGTLRHNTDHMEEMSLGQSVWIGCCQILSAVFPGTSRSMSTIAAGQIAGMSRAAALEFSFFLSIPTMVVATLYDLYKAMHPHAGEISVLGQITWTAQAWITLGIGFFVSFVVAYFVVVWFMNWVRTRGFVPFAVYRIIIGAAVLWWAVKA